MINHFKNHENIYLYASNICKISMVSQWSISRGYLFMWNSSNVLKSYTLDGSLDKNHFKFAAQSSNMNGSKLSCNEERIQEYSFYVTVYATMLNQKVKSQVAGKYTQQPVRQQPVDNREEGGRGRFLPVYEIILSRQNWSEIIFSAIWL